MSTTTNTEYSSGPNEVKLFKFQYTWALPVSYTPAGAPAPVITAVDGHPRFDTGTNTKQSVVFAQRLTTTDAISNAFTLKGSMHLMAAAGAAVATLLAF